MHKIKEKLSAEKKRFKREARNQTIAMVITSLGFVAGLAWNEAIKSGIEFFFQSGNGMSAKIVYALLVTGIVVFATSTLTRFKASDEEEGENQ